jgi:hypothetical protein
MFRFFDKPCSEYKVFFSNPFLTPEEREAQKKCTSTSVYIYPTDNTRTSFEYHLIDHQQNHSHTGIIQDQQLCVDLKAVANNFGQLTPSLKIRLIKSLVMSNIEKMLVVAIKDQKRDDIQKQLHKSLNKEPSEQAVNTCLDKLIDKLFRTPIWYQMIDEARHELHDDSSTPSIVP